LETFFVAEENHAIGVKTFHEEKPSTTMVPAPPDIPEISGDREAGELRRRGSRTCLADNSKK
jgi:hypothetical protein